MPNPTQIPANRVEVIDARTNVMSREWYLFFQNLLGLAQAGGGGGGSGTVTAVDVIGGSTGLVTSGGPVTTSGTITFGGTVNVAHGGTGATTAAGAISNLGAYSASNPAGYTNNLGTVTSVAALTLGTTGIDISSTVATGTTTPVITLNIPTASATNRGALSAADWTTFNNKGTVNSVTATAPVASSGGATPDISMAAATTSVDGYLTSTDWNTFNNKQAAFGSQTANFVYAAPNGSAGVPSFRALVAVDIPTLNQNTTGTASNVTGVVAIANGGTGQTAQTAAFDALAPTTTKGDLVVYNSTDNVRLPVGTDTFVLTADSTQATGVKWASGGGSVTIANDTTTATNEYPLFAAATSGSATTIYTGNAKYLYKPSTGELTSEHFVAGNGIFVNKLAIATNYTIAAGYSGSSAGPITINTGITVTVSSGSRWVVI